MHRFRAWLIAAGLAALPAGAAAGSSRDLSWNLPRDHRLEWSMGKGGLWESLTPELGPAAIRETAVRS
jgi:hypothetical protein